MQDTTTTNQPSPTEAEKVITPPVADGLLEKIKNIFLQEYEPVNNMTDTNILLSTNEIYRSMQLLYPSQDYSQVEVAQWMHQWGFTFTNTGTLKFEWILKKTG